jgi:GT2 family glycosyltransferase/glycosyltransferase involved in cell wall biosynthesis
VLGVIVTHNSVGVLRRCLQALAGAVSAVDARVLVADSGSSDDVAAVCERLGVPFLPGPNLGLGAAFNRALADQGICRPRYLLQLNPDVVLPPGSLDALVELADRRPSCGVLAPRHIDQHGRLLFSIGVEPDPAGYWRAAVDPRRHTWVWETSGYDYEHDVDWASGACLLLRTDLLSAIGGFDERFFLSSEEVDLCHRCREADWSVTYTPAVTIIHPIAGRAVDPHRLRLEEWSRILYLRKWHRILSRTSMRLAIAMRLARLVQRDTAAGETFGRARVRLGATVRFNRRRYGPAPGAMPTTGPAMEQGGLRMVLCENGLASHQGHHFNLVVGVKTELARRGVPLSVLSHVEVEPEVRAELETTPVFELSPYTNLMGRSRGRQVRSWLIAGQSFASGLHRSEIRTGDVLLVLTARPAELLGLGAWAWSRRRLPRAIVLNFMTDDFRPARTFASPALVGLLYRCGFALLRLRVGRGRLLLTSASESLAASVGRRLDTHVTVSPVLKAYPPSPLRPEASEPTIGFLGTPRSDKGEDLLARVIDACAVWLPDARVVAQVPADFATPPRGWPDNVHLAPTGLDRDSYYELLGQLDLVVLPYRREQFGDMVSGVFSEAVACGAATVVPAGSWMATMIERGHAAGLTFQDFDVTSILGAIATAEDRLDDLRRQAASLQVAWRAEQSISSYVDQLMAELGRRRLA